MTLSGVDMYLPNGCKMRTLSTIHQMLQSRHKMEVINYLKLDIGGSEWDVLPHIIESGMLEK